MTDALIIGVGNDLRRDDAVGRVVAERIEALGLSDVEVLSVSQLVPELAERMAGVRRVIVIDATVAAEELTVQRAGPPGSVGLTHHGDPAALAGWARLMNGSTPEVYVVSIPIDDLGLGEGLSDRARLGVEHAIGVVRNLVDEMSGG